MRQRTEVCGLVVDVGRRCAVSESGPITSLEASFSFRSPVPPPSCARALSTAGSWRRSAPMICQQRRHACIRLAATPCVHRRLCRRVPATVVASFRLLREVVAEEAALGSQRRRRRCAGSSTRSSPSSASAQARRTSTSRSRERPFRVLADADGELLRAGGPFSVEEPLLHEHVRRRADALRLPADA